jgi:hypothetical protein
MSYELQLVAAWFEQYLATLDFGGYSHGDRPGESARWGFPKYKDIASSICVIFSYNIADVTRIEAA